MRPLHRHARTTALLLAAALVAPAAVPRALHAAAPEAFICTSGFISEIFVDNKSVFDVGEPGLDARFNWAYRLANRFHVRTRESVVRRELLFKEGDCYDPALLEDSERILRNSNFISDADVFAVRQPDGSYHVVVETHDEWSTRLEPQLDPGSDFELSGAELREDNLLGTGQHVGAFLGKRYGRQVYGASYGTSQLFGTQLDAAVEVERTPVGTGFAERVTYPFRGEAGRWAFREQFQQQEHFFEFFRRDEEGRLRSFLFPERRRTFDVGAVTRLGQRGNLTLFGLGLAGEWVAYPQGAVLVPRDGLFQGAQEDTALAGLDTISSVRLVFLAGQRNVRFDRRRALDAVRGTEDVVLGTEVEVGVGRSLTAFSDDDDVSLDLGAEAAGDIGPVFAGARFVISGQRDFASPADSSEWRNVFSQLDAWAYWHPSPSSRHTLVAALTGSGGWHTDIPFQLTLGARTGLRGFARNAFPGQRRAVATLEGRSYWGWPFPDLLDVGSAVFVDVGRIWAGRDPFGEDSPWAADAGVGLRLAFPPGSRRTYRIDLAAPLTRADPRGLRLSIGVGQAVGRGALRDDPQIRRSAPRRVSASVFSFP